MKELRILVSEEDETDLSGLVYEDGLGIYRIAEDGTRTLVIPLGGGGGGFTGWTESGNPANVNAHAGTLLAAALSADDASTNVTPGRFLGCLQLSAGTPSGGPYVDGDFYVWLNDFGGDDVLGFLIFGVDSGWQKMPLVQNLAGLLALGNDAGARTITGLAVPAASGDAATKSYVDSIVGAKPTVGLVTVVSDAFLETSKGATFAANLNGAPGHPAEPFPLWGQAHTPAGTIGAAGLAAQDVDIEISGIPDSASTFTVGGTLIVTNADGTEVIVVQKTDIVPAHTAYHSLAWNAATVIHQVGVDLSWSAGSQEVTSAAGGVYSAHMYLNTGWNS